MGNEWSVIGGTFGSGVSFKSNTSNLAVSEQAIAPIAISLQAPEYNLPSLSSHDSTRSTPGRFLSAIPNGISSLTRVKNSTTYNYSSEQFNQRPWDNFCSWGTQSLQVIARGCKNILATLSGFIRYIGLKETITDKTVKDTHSIWLGATVSNYGRESKTRTYPAKSVSTSKSWALMQKNILPEITAREDSSRKRQSEGNCRGSALDQRVPARMCAAIQFSIYTIQELNSLSPHQN